MDNKSATEQHKDLIRACNLAGLSYADCMRIVAYMPVLSNHEDGGRAAPTKEFVPQGSCTCAGPDSPCEGCIANREAYEEWLVENQMEQCIQILAMYVRRLSSTSATDKTRAEAVSYLNQHGLLSRNSAPVALGGEPPCNPHPDAPHGYNRNASHNAGRYVCDCEGWAALGGEKRWTNGFRL